MTSFDYYMLYGFIAVIGGLASDKKYLLWMGLVMQTLALLPGVITFFQSEIITFFQ